LSVATANNFKSASFTFHQETKKKKALALSLWHSWCGASAIAPHPPNEIQTRPSGLIHPLSAQPIILVAVVDASLVLPPLRNTAVAFSAYLQLQAGYTIFI